MRNIGRITIKYIRKQDRAVTIKELIEQTDIEDTTQNYDQISKIFQHLEQEEFISSDGDLIEETLNYTARFYPTNELYSTNIEQIIDKI